MRFWIKFSLFNIIIVALYGTLMRYKIGFAFPFFEQKNLLEAHSHFAFTGWISQTLMVLMVMSIQRFLDERAIKIYKAIFIANLVCAYCMLISFTFTGYGVISIAFSSLSILISYYFSWHFIKHLRTTAKSSASKNWYIAALTFNILSSFGTYALVYMMVTKSMPELGYLGSIYFFLHFQYNGWFLFGCFGLLWDKLCELVPEMQSNKSVFWMFFLACLPAYFLSTLWMNFPPWLYWIIVLSAIVQVIAWGKLLLLIRQHIKVIKNSLEVFSKYIFLFVAITCSIKFLLQLFSTIPVISKLAFGFRPIVIAYLHLVLLAVISVFILAWLFSFNFIKTNKLSKTALLIFIGGVFLNEFALMIQGVASFSYFPVPHINEALFIIAVVMLLGAVLLFVSQMKHMPEKSA